VEELTISSGRQLCSLTVVVKLHDERITIITIAPPIIAQRNAGQRRNTGRKYPIPIRARVFHIVFDTVEIRDNTCFSPFCTLNFDLLTNGKKLSVSGHCEVFRIGPKHTVRLENA
jgi:hypothetical protein